MPHLARQQGDLPSVVRIVGKQLSQKATRVRLKTLNPAIRAQ